MGATIAPEPVYYVENRSASFGYQYSTASRALSHYRRLVDLNLDAALLISNRHGSICLDHHRRVVRGEGN